MCIVAAIAGVGVGVVLWQLLVLVVLLVALSFLTGVSHVTICALVLEVGMVLCNPISGGSRMGACACLPCIGRISVLWRLMHPRQYIAIILYSTVRKCCLRIWLSSKAAVHTRLPCIAEIAYFYFSTHGSTAVTCHSRESEVLR